MNTISPFFKGLRDRSQNQCDTIFFAETRCYGNVFLFNDVSAIACALSAQDCPDPGSHHYSEGSQSGQLPGSHDGQEYVS